MKIKYVGTSDVRNIRKSDWGSVDPSMGGPIEHDAVVWDASNNFTADVSGKAAEFLLQYDPEFKEIHEQPKKSG